VSSLVNRLTVEVFEVNTYGTIAQSLGILVVLLVAALLLWREMLRAHGGRPVAAGALSALDVATVPLLAAAGTVILLRTAQFL
jgi:hypothetical protein